MPPQIEELFRIQFSQEDIEALREALSNIRNRIEIKLFIARSGCLPCDETLKFLQLVVENSPIIGGKRAIDLKVYSKEEHNDLFAKYNIERVPTLLLLDGSITYLGMPAGEEMKAFVETLIRISSGDHGLSETTVKALSTLEGAADIEVIVTPLCNLCPFAVLLVNMFAYVSKVFGKGNVRAIVVEAFENPDIADKYFVTSVPTIVINGRVVFIGIPYEYQLLDAVKKLALLRI